MTATSLDRPTVTPSFSTAVNPGRSERSRHRTLPLALYFIHNDHLGTPMKVTDTQQRVVWSMEQTPFGEVNLTTEGLRMPMRFPGQYADVESGFSYNYFRDYDPSLGRYIQSDPIGLRAGLNEFSYATLSPLRFVDPKGQSAVSTVLIVVAVVATAVATYEIAEMFERLANKAKQYRESLNESFEALDSNDQEAFDAAQRKKRIALKGIASDVMEISVTIPGTSITGPAGNPIDPVEATSIIYQEALRRATIEKEHQEECLE